MRVDVVVLQHGCHLIESGILLVKRRFCLRSPDLAQQPLASLETTVFIVLLVFMSLLQEQNSDCESENHDQGADNVWQKEWESFEDSADESSVKRFRGFCENAAKGSANDGAVKRRSVDCRNACTGGESLPKTPHKGHDRIGARYKNQFTIDMWFDIRLNLRWCLSSVMSSATVVWRTPMFLHIG